MINEKVHKEWLALEWVKTSNATNPKIGGVPGFIENVNEILWPYFNHETEGLVPLVFYGQWINPKTNKMVYLFSGTENWIVENELLEFKPFNGTNFVWQPDSPELLNNSSIVFDSISLSEIPLLSGISLKPNSPIPHLPYWIQGAEENEDYSIFVMLFDEIQVKELGAEILNEDVCYYLMSNPAGQMLLTKQSY